MAHDEDPQDWLSDWCMDYEPMNEDADPGVDVFDEAPEWVRAAMSDDEIVDYVYEWFEDVARWDAEDRMTSRAESGYCD